MDDRELVTLREYLEQIAEEREKAHLVVHEMDRRSVIEAQRTIEKRLELLNELRETVIADRSQFLRLDVFDQKHNSLEERVRLHERQAATQSEVQALLARIDILESWRLRATGIFLVLVPLAGVIGAAIMRAFG